MDPTYPFVPIVNFMTSFPVLATLSSKMFKKWNVGVCMFGLWLSLVGITIGVDTIIWSDSADDIAPVWCDICKSSES